MASQSKSWDEFVAQLLTHRVARVLLQDLVSIPHVVGYNHYRIYSAMSLRTPACKLHPKKVCLAKIGIQKPQLSIQLGNRNSD